ncbi:MAG: hypothetical protein M3Z32_06885 [Acidobacteriota bacterium]|nr:hypothetical protein [Acidobacteriota bacterium]
MLPHGSSYTQTGQGLCAAFSGFVGAAADIPAHLEQNALQSAPNRAYVSDFAKGALEISKNKQGFAQMRLCPFVRLVRMPPPRGSGAAIAMICTRL